MEVGGCSRAPGFHPKGFLQCWLCPRCDRNTSQGLGRRWELPAEGRARWRHRVCSAGSASLGPAGQGRAVLGQHSREGQSWLSPAAPWAGLAVGAVTSQQLGMFSGAIPSVLCHGLCLGGPEGRALGHPELLLGHQGFPGRGWRLPVPPVPFLFPVGRKQQALRLGPSL